MNPNTPISSIMSTDLVTVSPNAALAEVSRLFEENNFHHLPVLEDSKLIGIISKQDFLQASHVLSYSWKGEANVDTKFHIFHARDIMTEYPMHLDPDDTVGLAADIFMSNKFHALPIVEDLALVGIVTTHDLISFAFKSPVVAITD